MKFTCVIQDHKMKPVPGVVVRVHPFRRPRQVLVEGRTDARGYVDVAIADDKVPETLVVRVLNADGDALIHRAPARKTKEISSWWAVEIPGDWVQPPPADDEPDVDDPRPEEPAEPKVVLTPTEIARTRIDRARELREGLREAAREEVGRRRRKRQRGKDLGRRVLGRRPQRRGRLLFVPRGDDATPVQEKARLEGLQRFQRFAPDMRGIPLYDADAERLGIKGGDELTAETILALLEGAGENKPAASPVEAALKQCRAQHVQEDLAGPEDDESVAVTATAETALKASTTVERVSAILDAALGAPGKRPSAADIGASLDMELPKGPADVDAFYDFRSLQIAWSDAWTASVDAAMQDRIKAIYDAVLDLVAPEDIEPDLAEVEELDATLELLDDAVDAAAETFSEANASAPTWIAAWEPRLGDVWNYLPEERQRYVEVQYEIEQYLQGIGIGGGHKLKGIKKFHPFSTYDEDYLPRGTVFHLNTELDLFPARYRNRALAAVDIPAAQRAKERAETSEQNENSRPGRSGQGAGFRPPRTRPDEQGTTSARLSRAQRLIAELKEAMAEPFQFDVFTEDSYNFGVMTTYRQRWRPLDYQAGDLAASIPLAPNEKRSYAVTTKSSTRRSLQQEREVMHGRTDEHQSTRRAEAAINETIKRKTNAKATTEAKGKLFDVVEIRAQGEFSHGQEKQSARIKKEIREVTRKAVQEYRDQHKVTVETEESAEVSVSESRELANPNNELTVTYLLYELQRRYEVSERLHDVTPVILVAFDMPQPGEITEGWLLQHDWILRDNLLDDSYRQSLRYLSETFSGDEFSVEILQRQWKAQLTVVNGLRRQGETHQTMRDLARDAVENSVAMVGAAQAAGDLFGGGIGGFLAKHIFDAGEEVAEAQSENARAALEWSEQDLDRIEASVREAATALERATASYVQAVEKRLNRRTQIDRLIIHVKENIHHYMQAIWREEHPDSRYLRLYDTEIQWPGPLTARVTRNAGSGSIIDRLPFFRDLGRARRVGSIQLAPPEFKETRQLHQVADIHTLLGFRGNLAVFPLTEHNAISSFMAQEFLDPHFGSLDPDPFSDLPTASEALAIAECAWRRMGDDEGQRKEVAEWLMDALAAAHRVSEEVVVPTGELFIEALPGAHPLLEDHKLEHRAFDAAQAATGVRSSQLDLIRKAMRLEAGDVSDPDVDRYIRVEGGVTPTIDTD